MKKAIVGYVILGNVVAENKFYEHKFIYHYGLKLHQSLSSRASDQYSQYTKGYSFYSCSPRGWYWGGRDII